MLNGKNHANQGLTSHGKMRHVSWREVLQNSQSLFLLALMITFKRMTIFAGDEQTYSLLGLIFVAWKAHQGCWIKTNDISIYIYFKWNISLRDNFPMTLFFPFLSLSMILRGKIFKFWNHIKTAYYIIIPEMYNSLGPVKKFAVGKFIHVVISK